MIQFPHPKIETIVIKKFLPPFIIFTIFTLYYTYRISLRSSEPTKSEFIETLQSFSKVEGKPQKI